MGSSEQIPVSPEPTAAPPDTTAPPPPPPAKKSRLWLWILVGIVAALIVIVIVLLLTLPADTAEVPDVTGLSLTAGVAALEDAGLKLGEVSYTSDVPAGTKEGQIVSQKPAAGESVDKGSAVNVVAAGKAETKVPDVRSMTKDEAVSALAAVGLEAKVVEVADEAKPGTVVDQSPDPGTSVAPGSQVTVLVSTGPAESLVPNVVGMTEDEAAAALENAEYQVESKTTYDQQTEKGRVISQTPEAGTVAQPGSTVTITVSNGPNPEVKVPDVVGKTEPDAAKVLGDAGLETIPSSSFNEAVAAGNVISQNPTAGSTAPVGSAVGISVSLGPKPAVTAVVPDVVGKTEAQATDALKIAGYQVAAARAYSDTVAKDVVAGQAPLAGSVTQPGITVGILVSDGPRPGIEFVTVPDVSGMSLEEATASLEKAGLKVTSSEFFTELAPQGEVFAQLPPPGYPVAPGSPVLVIVSKGPYLQVNPL